jgi:hypothetical protein
MKSFAIINPVEISELAKLKASGCAVLTYTTLAGFARNKGSCFPSIRTISEALGNAYTTRAIQKALKWLCDSKLIKRNDKRSKQRFILLKRLKTIGTNVRKAYKEQSFPVIEPIEKNSFFKRGKAKINKFSKFKKKRPAAPQQNTHKSNESSRVCEAEQVFQRWMLSSPTYDVGTINKADSSVIVRCLNSQAVEDREWREAMMWSESNKLIFDKLLAL